jgi:hypothetical protein
MAAAARDWLLDVALLVMFDLRRHRGTAALLVTMEIVRLGLAEASVRTASVHGIPVRDGVELAGTLWRGGIGVYDTVLWFASLLAMATLVQADHPADDRAFWRTRPIAPATLAAGKLAAIGLLCVAVPALVNAGRLAAYGAPLASIGASVVQVAVLAGFTLLPAWPVALATRTVPRFFAGTILVLVAAFYLALAFGYPPYTHHPIHGGFRHGMPLPVFDWRRHDLLGWWTSLAFAGAGAALVIAHYAMRRAWVSVPAGAALLATMIAWPTGWTPAPAPPELTGLIDGRLRLDAIGGIPAGRLAEYPDHPVPVYGPVGLPWLPPGVSARLALGPTTIQAGTRRIVATGRTQCCRGNGPMTLHPPGQSPLRNGFPYVFNDHLFVVDRADVPVLAEPRLGVRAPVTLDLTRHVTAGSLSLQPGASLRTGRYLVEVIAPSSDRVVVVRLARFPTLGNTDDPQVWLLWTDARGLAEYAGSEWWGTDGDWREGFERPGWANGRTWVDRFAFRVGWGKTPPARLVVVEARDAGRMTTTLVAPDVIVTPPERP